MIWSFVYLAVRRIMELLLLCLGSCDAKELEILVLRDELEIFRRQHPRGRLEPKDRALLAALSRLLPRRRWSVFVVTPGHAARLASPHGPVTLDLPQHRETTSAGAWRGAGIDTCGWPSRTRAGATSA